MKKLPPRNSSAGLPALDEPNLATLRALGAAGIMQEALARHLQFEFVAPVGRILR